MAVVLFLIMGLIAGLIARAVVPGRDEMNLLGTLLLGVVGSFVGGVLWALFTDWDNILSPNPGGILLSIIGAVVALLVYNRFVKSRVT